MQKPNSIPRQLIKFFWQGLSIVIVIVALILSLTRTAMPYITRHQLDFANRFSILLKQPVKIEMIETAWRSFEPVIRLHNVVLLDKQTGKPVLNIHDVYIGVNIWQSIINGRFELSLLSISNLPLDFVETQKQEVYIKGLTGIPPFKLNNSNDKTNPLLVKLFQINHLDINNADLSWQSNNKPIIHLKGLALTMTNQNNFHRLSGNVDFLQAETTPAHIRWLATIEGDIAHKQQLKAQVYLNVNQISLNYLSKFIKQNLFTIKAGNLSGQFWFAFKNGRLHVMHANPYLAQIVLQPKDNSTTLNFQTIQGDLLLHFKNKHQWLLSGQNIQVVQNGVAWPLLQTYMQEGNHQILYLSYVRLDSLFWLLNQLPQMPAKIKQLLQHLAPQGILTNLLIKHEPRYKQFAVSSTFTGIHLHAWEQIPGLTNLTGSTMFDNNHGILQIASRSFTLNLSQVFNQPLFFERLNSNVSWQKVANKWQVKISQLLAVNKQIGVRGTIHLLVPIQQPKQISIYALLGIANFNLQYLNTYLPIKYMSPKLVNWLNQGVKSGRADYTTLLIRGPLLELPYDQAQGVIYSNSDISQVNLIYNEHWPELENISGTLAFAGRKMQANITDGQTVNSQIKNAIVTIPFIGHQHGETILVDTNILGDLQDALNFLTTTTSPLYHKVGKDLTNLQLQGPMALHLNLVIPLKEIKDKTQVIGVIKTNNANLNLPRWQLGLTNLAGEFNFDNNRFYAKQLSGLLFDRPTLLSIQTTTENAVKVTHINLTGTADFNRLAKRYHVPVANEIQGVGAYTANLLLRPKPSGNEFNLSSNLIGVNLNFPEQYYKSAASKSALNLQLLVAEKQATLTFNYNQMFNGILLFNNINNSLKLKTSTLTFGAKPAALIGEHGIYINGSLPTFTYTLWQPLFKSIQQQLNNQTSNVKKNKSNYQQNLQRIFVYVQQLNVFNQIFKNAFIDIYPTASTWPIQIDAPTIAGMVIVPKNYPKGMLTANLDYLVLPAEKSNGGHAKPINPENFSAMQVNIKQFSIANRNFGILSFIAKPILNGLNIAKFFMSNNSQTITGSGAWLWINHHSVTHFQGQYTSQALAESLTLWQLPILIDSDDVRSQLNLTWPNVPYQLDLAHLSGQAYVQMGEGRILQLSEQTNQALNLGRLLTLLSLHSIPRRLTFNFSDLFHPGFSFESLNGNINFNNGVASTNNLALISIIGNVNIGGSANLATRQLQLIIKIVPDVTANLPVIAAIAGGPFAGLATLIANELVKHAIHPVVTRYYAVNGDWRKPLVQQVVPVGISAKN